MRHRGRSGNTVFLAGSLLFCAAFGARAETQVGGAVLSGEVETGGKFLSGNTDSSQWNEYRDQRPGFFGSSHFLLEDAERKNYLGFDYDYVGTQDQRYEARFGHWGLWGVDLEFLEFPYDYGIDARSLYLQQGDRYLLPPGLQATLQPLGAAARATVLGNALSTAPGVDLEAMYRTGRAEVNYNLTNDMQAKVEYSVQHRLGTQPLGIAYGSPGGNFADFPGQVNDWTHNVDAGINFLRDTWNVALNYSGSFYQNNIDSLTVANPLRATDSATVGAFGTLSRAPDNQANTFSLTGAWKVPVAFPTRITGTFSYGQRTQDDDFVPETTNTAILAANPAVRVLPQKNLEGRIYTYLANVVLTSRPTEDLNLKLRYHYYDYDNATSSIQFLPSVLNDASLQNTTSLETQYWRQDASLDAVYQLCHPLSMTFGFDWDEWNRSFDREVERLNTYTGRMSLDFHPNTLMQFRATYALSGRRGSTYNPDPRSDFEASTQLPSLRMSDLADLWRNEVNFLGQFALLENLDSTVSFGFVSDDYEHSPYGLTARQQWNTGTDITYRPFKWLGLSAGYEYQDIYTNQKDRCTGVFVGCAPGVGVPQDDWSSHWHTAAHNATAGIDITMIPDLLDLRVSYGFQRSNDRTTTNGVSGGPFHEPLNYPEDGDTLQYLTTRIDYHVTPHMTLRASWRWERFDIYDFRHTDFYPFNPVSNNNTQTGAVSPSTNVYLGDRIGSYNVNIVGFSAIYKF